MPVDIANNTVALIGPDLSEIARAVADLAGVFHVPIISPSATNQVLGDRNRFPHFFRTVSPDSFQAKLIIDLIVFHKWNYIVLLTSDDDYGRSGQSALRAHIRESSFAICTVIDHVIKPYNIPAIIADIKHLDISQIVVVLFATDSVVMNFVSKCQHRGLIGYTFIASDSWTRASLIQNGFANVLNGMLGVGPRSLEVKGFRRELIGALKNGSHFSQWKEEFLCLVRRGCRYNESSECMIQKGYDKSPFIASTYDAVYAIAHALHKMLKCTTDYCNRDLYDQKKLLGYLKNIEFESVSGNYMFFDEFGSAASKYQVSKLPLLLFRGLFCGLSDRLVHSIFSAF